MTFEHRIANRFGDVSSSPIRDILSVVGHSEIISFAGGIPDPNLFPVEALKEASDWVLETHPKRALQYATTVGEPELRDQAARRLSKHLPTSPDQIQITSGSQEGIYLAAQALVDPGDTVLVEEPTYLAAVQAFRMGGARLVSVPADDEGVIPAELERLIVEHDPKLVYLIPTFQNPTGRTMSLERRQAVAEILIAHGTTLLEDDPYGEIRFDGEPVPPMCALPGMGAQTLYLNSMSKVLAPGVRVGWIRGEGPVMKAVEVAKQAVALQSSVTDQLMVARYLETNDLDAHVRTIIETYRGRRDALADGLVARFPDAKVNRPVGGMFCWAALGEGVDTQELFKLAIAEGVAFVPGWPFYAEHPDRSTMRLSYVTNSPETIAEGLDRLARAHAAYRA